MEEYFGEKSGAILTKVYSTEFYKISILFKREKLENSASYINCSHKTAKEINHYDTWIGKEKTSL